MSLKNYLDERAGLKKFVHWTLIPQRQARPRWWVRKFVNPLVHTRLQHAIIRRSVRMDVLPFNQFRLGKQSCIDDFSVINNGVGDVFIGDNTLVGIGNVIIGPVSIGNNVILAQHVVLSGLNHDYEDVNQPIREQPVSTRLITIEDDCWIGANVTITAGVTIGKHSVVAGGSVVTRDVPPFTVVGGNPARPLKVYDEGLARWVRAPKPVEVPA